MNSLDLFVCKLSALATLTHTHMLNSLAQWLDLRWAGRVSIDELGLASGPRGQLAADRALTGTYSLAH